MQSAACADDSAIKRLVDRAEMRKAARIGCKRPHARERLAHEWGLSFWTFENWRKGRLKRAAEVREKITAGLVQEIKAEIEGLNRELEVAMACGVVASQSQVESLRDAIAQGQRLLDEVSK